MQSDAGLVPDPERIVSAFEEELAALRLARPAWTRTGRKAERALAAGRRSRGVA